MKDPKLRRTHRMMITLNDYEKAALNAYCRKYKITNKANVVRKAIFSQIITNFELNYPTLFTKEELERL